VTNADNVFARDGPRKYKSVFRLAILGHRDPPSSRGVLAPIRDQLQASHSPTRPHAGFYSKYFSNLRLSIGAGPVFFIWESTMVCIGELPMSLGRVGSRGGRAASRPGARDPLIIALVPCQQNQRSSPLLFHLCLAVEDEVVFGSR